MDHSGSRAQLRQFLAFIQEENICSQENLREVIRFRDCLDRRLVNLATVKGYVNPKDLLDAMASHLESKKSLGAHLVDIGLLSQEQFTELTEMQNPHSLRLLGDCFVRTDTLKPEAFEKALDAFRKSAPGPASESPPVTDPEPIRSAEEVRNVLKNVTRVFTLPTVVQKILSLLDDPSSDMRDTAKLIESDPSISSQVLRLVNSAMFGLRTKITNLRQAVVTLGTRGTRRLILTTVAAGSFIRLKQDQGRQLWTHSLRAAYWAREPVSPHNPALLDDAFTAGILHEIGSVILLQLYPKEMTRIQELVEGGAAPMASEAHFFGMTHAEIGAFLCRHWNFPPPVTQSVIHHHAPVPVLRVLPDVPDLAKAVHASCRLADVATEILTTTPSAGVEGEFLEYHELTTDKLKELAPQIQRSADEMISLLF